MIAALLFENENAADMEIPRENIMQLTEHQFVLPVSETASKRKPQKRRKVLRRCEANSGILENMSAREQRYNAQEALERIWNDSGDEEDFDGDEKQ